ncbi:mismatch-specific DNA-glycosylase [Paramicrobacterium agarici]|uniref:mismatch-specific DNA-glycosylase n=1 Tax=Paramicrobacterium agarici TaxID=630514 RepID=UPI00114DC3D9|nr:mismatch-specific DNA-glycosylase [Microbacterium agarici]TQO23889.1 G/U mismatch-specific uracil-DNA glycosylase [Microbacterium agarici]
MPFTREQLESFRNAPVPDLVDDGVLLLFVGINPGLWTAATSTPFAHPGNRFFPALREAGIFDAGTRFSDGLSDSERRRFTNAGLGVTNLVNRATVRADELSLQELRDGAEALERRVARLQPRVVAMVGLTAYRQGFRRPKARAGGQEQRLAGAELWAVPNPSGLNAHETIESLAHAYAAPARSARVIS